MSRILDDNFTVSRTLQTLGAFQILDAEDQNTYLEYARQDGAPECAISCFLACSRLAAGLWSSHLDPGHKFLHDTDIGCAAYRILLAHVSEALSTFAMAQALEKHEAAAEAMHKTHEAAWKALTRVREKYEAETIETIETIKATETGTKEDRR